MKTTKKEHEIRHKQPEQKLSVLNDKTSYMSSLKSVYFQCTQILEGLKHAEFLGFDFFRKLDYCDFCSVRSENSKAQIDKRDSVDKS